MASDLIGGISGLGAYYMDSTSKTLDRFSAKGAGTTGDFSKLLNQAQAHKDAAEGGEGGAPNSLAIDKTDKLYEQCQALETFLVKSLISGMRKTVVKSDFIDTGFAGEMYEDMLYDEYAKSYSEHAGFGLAELAYKELTGQRGIRS
jgi:flagellar protein FlgJ